MPASQPTLCPMATQEADDHLAVATAALDQIAANVERVIQGKPEVIELALSACWPKATCSSRTCPASARPAWPRPWPRSIDCTFGSGCSSPPTCCPPTSSASPSGTAARDEFEFRPGPVFANIVLGDEINRASPRPSRPCSRRWRSARSPSTARPTRSRPPFMVIATQNPIEHEGTYPLPESQLDRFLMRVVGRLPRPRSTELEILDTHARPARSPSIAPVVTAGRRRRRWSTRSQAVHVAPALKGYLVDLADATRATRTCALGMSPRATLAPPAGGPGPGRGRGAQATSSPTT